MFPQISRAFKICQNQGFRHSFPNQPCQSPKQHVNIAVAPRRDGGFVRNIAGGEERGDTTLFARSGRYPPNRFYVGDLIDFPFSFLVQSWRGVLNKGRYGEAPTRDTAPYVQFTIFDRKSAGSVYLIFYPFHIPTVVQNVASLLTVENALSLKYEKNTKLGNFLEIFTINYSISPFRSL